MTHPGSRSGYNRAMSGGSIWHRTLVYFGLAEDESLYDDHSPVQEEVERAPRMPSVRRIDRRRGRASADEYDDLFSAEETSPGRPRRDDDTGVGLGGSSGLGASSGFGAGSGSGSYDRGSRGSDLGALAGVETSILRSAPPRSASPPPPAPPPLRSASPPPPAPTLPTPARSSISAQRVHVIAPRSYNDAQQIADRFKNGVPVIMNLQTSEADLSRRLIDFGSGMTYGLDGAIQRIAEKVFLLTPKNVEVSAEDRQRLVDQGFFSPPS